MDRPEGAELTITFLYYRDLPGAMRFYEQVMGLTLVIDQGWSKIYRTNAGAHVGLVDEARGMHRSHPVKPVQLCLRVPDVGKWREWIASHDIPVSKLFENETLGIRAFVFDDPEGYQIEIQTPTRPGA